MSVVFRSGDVVRHHPSGEKWLLAWGNEREVSACGWPESIAKAADCELLRAASDKEYREMVADWAKKVGEYDYRVSVCRGLWDQIQRADAQAGVR